MGHCACVVGVCRRPQVELMTEGLTCIDSRTGGISQGLERGEMGFSSSDSITTVFLKLGSVILIKLLSNLQGAIHEGICDLFIAQALRKYRCSPSTTVTYLLWLWAKLVWNAILLTSWIFSESSHWVYLILPCQSMEPDQKQSLAVFHSPLQMVLKGKKVKKLSCHLQ